MENTNISTNSQKNTSTFRGDLNLLASPPNPRVTVSPWYNSSYGPDVQDIPEQQ